MRKETFTELFSVNVNEHTEKKKSGSTELTYLSWPFAMAELLKTHPDMTYEVWKDENHRPYVYDENLGYMVFTSVTIDGDTKEMWLPVMDSHNAAMKNVPYDVKTKYSSYTVPAATMFDINKTIMRCLVKNLAMFGLGLYIYAGEDLPEYDVIEVKSQKTVAAKDEPKKAETKKAANVESIANVQHVTSEQANQFLGMIKALLNGKDNQNKAYTIIMSELGITSLKSMTIDMYDKAMNRVTELAVELAG